MYNIGDTITLPYSLSWKRRIWRWLIGKPTLPKGKYLVIGTVGTSITLRAIK